MWSERLLEESSMVRPSTLSVGQEKVLSLLSAISGCLSIAGSSTIVYKVLSNRDKAAPYDRLLLGLSICDIVASLTYALSPFLLPSTGGGNRVWAFGNEATCDVLGWMTQFSFAAILYNGALSFYYLATVRFGVKRQRFGTRIEPLMHAFIWIFSLATSTFGVIIGLFNELELGFGCWANNYPEGCVDAECKSRFYGWAIGAVPTLIVLFSLVINNIVIFVYVRRNFQSHQAISNASTDHHHRQTEEQAERFARQAAQTQEVARQGFLYVGTFFLSYSTAFIVRYLESALYHYEDEGDIFILLLFNYTLLPLQGFFNSFVYNFPNYTRLRAAYPDTSKFWAMRYALFNSDIPKLVEINMSNFTVVRESALGNRGGPTGTGGGSSAFSVRKSFENNSNGQQQPASNNKSELTPVPEQSNEFDAAASQSSEEESHKGPTFATPVVVTRVDMGGGMH